MLLLLFLLLVLLFMLLLVLLLAGLSESSSRISVKRFLELRREKAALV